ncbi:hypothetical protein YDYSY3_45320 [Paenibacillus chitinolyticus]|uniref:SIR2 family protein n=1 Tax=Paenibacillus chitinolyticus TaxID=79263 RepID=UPI0026E4D54A|nr:SIR2 family protein [Paenibacillus chitinolyticus]GKS13532.1 hypothetical protein YDYSY3_45320 [Paenibacillus chitinolyticus]
MSLKTLIATEITNQHIYEIERFLDEGYDNTYDSFIFESFLNRPEYQALNEWLISNSTVKVVYECSEDAEQIEWTAKDPSDMCVVCRQEISDETQHEYRMEYKIKQDCINELRSELVKFFEDKYLLKEYQQNFDLVKEERTKIVPFIGSGLSVPLGLPNWKQLLEKLSPMFSKEYHKEAYKDYTEQGDLLEALDYLKKWSIHLNTDDQIKDAIIKIIETEQKTGIDEELHNFYDVIKLNSNLYISTNYDLLLEKFLSSSVDYRAPLCLNDVDNLRKLLDENSQVLHIHGHIKRKDTMIVSAEDYKKLYEDNGLMYKLQHILTSRPLLYIGFSFSDKFFVDLYTNLGKIVKNHHYIIMANPDLEKARELNKQNIKVLGLKVALQDGKTDYDDLIIAIRTLINFIVK